MLRNAAAVLVLGAIAGCGVFGTSDTDAPGQPVDAGSDAASAVDASPSEPDAGPELDSGVDASKCEPSAEVKEEPGLEADGLISVNSPQLFGLLDVCNMSVGRCVFRFKPTPAAMAAMKDHRVVSLELTLTRADTSTNCGGSCTNLREGGTLTAQPLRSDWSEATMNWSSRDSVSGGGSWGAAGATAANIDVATDTFNLDVLASTLTPTLTLDASRWPAAFLASDRIAVVTDFQAAGTRKQFVTVAREASVTGATPKTAAVLKLRYCP
jgi:hypothetical protein